MGEKLILCSISTKDRYDSLIMAVQSVAMQTLSPDKLVIFDDGECKDLRKESTWQHMFRLLDEKGIKWEVLFGEKRGQHHNHQQANKMGYKYVWRLDDDEIAEPNVLEELYCHMKEDVGAVGGAVVSPNQKQEGGTNKMIDIYDTPNMQWNISPILMQGKEVEHLYSSFLYRAGIVDYNLNLSPVAHREETLFSHELFRNGYKLIVDNSIVTWHFRQEKGGIRSHTDKTMYDWDERIFVKKMDEWGIFIVELNVGLGDHLAFLHCLPELIEKHKDLIISCCYPEVFEDYKKLKLIPIQNLNILNPYKWMIDNKWEGNLLDAFRKMYKL